MDYEEICKQNSNFLFGVPLSGPLENVEIYFSKIDIEIFASDELKWLRFD